MSVTHYAIIEEDKLTERQKNQMIRRLDVGVGALQLKPPDFVFTPEQYQELCKALEETTRGLGRLKDVIRAVSSEMVRLP